MKRIPTPSPAMVVALAGVAIGLGGVAFATIPDSSGTIHGCYIKNGNLRIVESENDCRRNENTLAWNQQGRPGPPGTGTGVRTFYDDVSAEECTSSTTYTGLTTPGPAVQPTVPTNAIVLLQFSVDIQAPGPPGPEAHLGLFEPTDFSPPLFLTAAAHTGNAFVNEPGKFNSWTVIKATPGIRTYELQYRMDPSTPSGTACFKNRRLWITVFPVTDP